MSGHVRSIDLGRAGTVESHKMSFGIVYTSDIGKTNRGASEITCTRSCTDAVKIAVW